MKATLDRWRKAMPFDNPQGVPPTALVDKPLSTKAQQLREIDYARYAEALALRDKYQEENDRAKALCTSAKHEINALHEQISELKGRCTGYQLERDEAVAKAAKADERLRCVMEELSSLFARVQDQKTAPRITGGASENYEWGEHTGGKVVPRLPVVPVSSARETIK